MSLLGLRVTRATRFETKQYIPALRCARDRHIDFTVSAKRSRGKISRRALCAKKLNRHINQVCTEDGLRRSSKKTHPHFGPIFSSSSSHHFCSYTLDSHLGSDRYCTPSSHTTLCKLCISQHTSHAYTRSLSFSGSTRLPHRTSTPQRFFSRSTSFEETRQAQVLYLSPVLDLCLCILHPLAPTRGQYIQHGTSLGQRGRCGRGLHRWDAE